MNESNFIELPKEKIYKEKAIWVGTFLGGPLVAGYLIAENFKIFNDDEKVKKTWIISIITTILIFGGLFLIPETIKIPNQIIPLIYTGIAYYLVQHFQGEKINEHIKNGGKYFNWWRSIAVGFIGLLITIGTLVTFFIFSETTSMNSEASKKYGLMNHEIVFNNSVNIAEVDKIAEAFEKTTFFDNAVTKNVYLEKINNTYEISISCDKSIENAEDAQTAFIQLKEDMQMLFPKNKIVLNLVVESLDNVVKRIE